MKPQRFRPLAAALAAMLLLSACSDEVAEQEGGGDTGAEAPAAPAVETATAEETSALPIGTFPGTVTLPPEARVAVTSPFAGAAVRIFVIEGQGVSRGQPLALVRATEAFRVGGALARAESEVRVAEAHAARMEALADEGIVAVARADEARAQLEQARATRAENLRLASLAGAGPDGTMTLRAPLGGRVSHVGVETGGPVDPTSAPFVVDATDSYRLDLAIPERLALQVKPGMAVEVQLSAGGGQALTATGRILSVAPSIDPQTRSIMAKSTIEPVPGLVPGQNVVAVVTGSFDAAGVVIPSRAVTLIGGVPHVFVKAEDGFRAREVTVAAEAADRTVLADGLAAGEVVAISGIAELKAVATE